VHEISMRIDNRAGLALQDELGGEAREQLTLPHPRKSHHMPMGEHARAMQGIGDRKKRQERHTEGNRAQTQAQPSTPRTRPRAPGEPAPERAKQAY
jgi:hypothetical protein